MRRLSSFHATGLTNYEVLSAATRNAGEYLGDSGIGVIRAGAHADLLLVNASPLQDLATLRTPAGVMLRGQWLGSVKRRSARH